MFAPSMLIQQDNAPGETMTLLTRGMAAFIGPKAHQTNLALIRRITQCGDHATACVYTRHVYTGRRRAETAIDQRSGWSPTINQSINQSIFVCYRYDRTRTSEYTTIYQ